MAVSTQRTAETVAPIMGDLVPRPEIAAQLDVTEHTLRLWEVAGEGPPPICIGRRVFYRAEAVRAWLLEQEGKTNT